MAASRAAHQGVLAGNTPRRTNQRPNTHSAGTSSVAAAAATKRSTNSSLPASRIRPPWSRNEKKGCWSIVGTSVKPSRIHNTPRTNSARPSSARCRLRLSSHQRAFASSCQSTWRKPASTRQSSSPRPQADSGLLEECASAGVCGLCSSFSCCTVVVISQLSPALNPRLCAWRPRIKSVDS